MDKRVSLTTTGRRGPRSRSTVPRWSRSLAALGGFVAGPARYVELVENLARPYIFTTAPTPADTAAALAALRIVRSAEGDALVARLRALVERVRPGHPSPIIPFIIGDEQATLDAAPTGEPADKWCPPHRRYATPMAPPMAAAALGQPAFSLDQLADELAGPETGITFVEGAGGVLSPLADDGDTRGLIATIEPAL